MEVSPKEGTFMKILVLRFSALGDTVMTAWTVTALKNALPSSHITWAVQPRCAPLISPRLAESVVVPRDRGNKGSVFGMLKMALNLRRQRFDFGLDFQGHAKTAIVLKLAAPKRRLVLRATDGFTALISPPTPAPDDLLHIVEREAWLAGQITPIALPDRPMMPETPRLEPKDARPLVTVQMGAGWPGKAYPPEKMNQVIRGLTAEGCRVIALGGPQDPYPDSGENLVGQTNIAQTLSLLRLSHAHVAPDTGTGHMASALGVPLVSIFGPEDPAKCRPWGEGVKLLKEGRKTADVRPDQVIEAVIPHLRRSS
jgi:ADP-heptose:LPS heptosyltransferase